MATNHPNYSAEKVKLIQENGWDKGLILFGFLASETTVKVVTALKLVMSLDNDFPYKTESDLKHVEVSFDHKPLQTNAKTGQQSMGVRGEEWKIMSDGKGYMPALMMEGVMYQESGEIVKMLAQKYPDKTLSEEDNKEVMKWIDFNLEHVEKLLDTEKHFGIYALSPNEPNYQHLGAGKQDVSWEKDHVQYLHKFLKTLDDHFASMEEDKKTYFVANQLTYADCAMINWPYTAYHLMGLKVSKRYPNLWAHHVQLRAAKPPGASDHYTTMPILGIIIAILLLPKRGFISYGHHVENPMYWE